MLNDRFTLLKALCAEINMRGISVSIDEDTICIGREQWDRYSKRSMTMLSASPGIVHGDKSFFIFASEQHDENDAVVKYSIKLCDANKSELMAWDLDAKRGHHKHEYSSGKKNPKHILSSGSIGSIVDDLMNRVRKFDPSRIKSQNEY